MERKAHSDLLKWWKSQFAMRKPLVIRGARQVGKSYLVRDFCKREGIELLEINFEKEPSLRRFFVEGHNSKTVELLKIHFGKQLDTTHLLFLDEIQAAPEVFARLRYFFEDTPNIAVVAAGSLLEFALAELEYSVPVGRIEYLFLGPMQFEEYLLALGESSVLQLLSNWQPQAPLSEVIHNRLISHVRDFSVVGGMPEAVQRFILSKDFLAVESIQRNILETYRNDFNKFRKKVPIERLERVFNAIPSQVGKKWIHARVNPNEKAHMIDAALDALCKAKIAHRVYHSSGNGVPLAAEQKDNLYKVLCLDVGLMSVQLGLRISHLVDSESIVRVNEGAIAEQWIGQHLLDHRLLMQPPQLFYWVREKAGSMAEVDYLIPQDMKVIPVEVKAGSSSKAKSLQVFLNEKDRSWVAVHFSVNVGRYLKDKKILELPFYLVGQLSRILDSLEF